MDRDDDEQAPESGEVQPTGPELLEKFLRDNGLTTGSAVAALHVTRVAIWNWVNNKATPLEQLRLDIETWTNGAVPRESWGPLHDKRRGKRQEVKPFEASEPDEAPASTRISTSSKPEGETA